MMVLEVGGGDGGGATGLGLASGTGCRLWLLREHWLRATELPCRLVGVSAWKLARLRREWQRHRLRDRRGLGLGQAACPVPSVVPAAGQGAESRPVGETRD